MLAKVKFYLSKITTNENIVKNLIWQLGDKILRYSVSLVVMVWLARYLGPANNGILSYALSFTSLFGALVGFGMSTIAVTEISRQPERERSILGTAAAIMFAGTVISLLLQSILITQIRPGDTLMLALILIIGVSYLVRPLQAAVSFSYEAKPNYKPIVIASNIAFILSSLLKIAVIVNGGDLWAFATVTALEAVTLCALLLWHYQRTTPGVGSWRFEQSLFSRYLRQGFPLFLSGLATDLYMRIDMVMVGDLHSNHQAGIYSVAVTLVQIWYFLPVIAYNALFPNLVKLADTNPALFRQKMQKFYNYMALLTYTVCVPVTFFAGFIVKTLFGEAYQDSGTVLALLIWGTAFVNLGLPRNAWIYSHGHYRLQFEITVTSCVLNILLNLILIPPYGAVGATVATLVSYSYAAFFSNFVYKKIRENGWMMIRAIFKPTF